MVKFSTNFSSSFELEAEFFESKSSICGSLSFDNLWRELYVSNFVVCIVVYNFRLMFFFS